MTWINCLLVRHPQLRKTVKEFHELRLFLQRVESKGSNQPKGSSGKTI